MTELLPLLLAGAGGHARACIDVIEAEGRFTVGGLLGLPAEVGSRALGYPVIGTEADILRLRERFAHAMVTVGQIKSAETRIRIFGLLRAAGYMLPSVVSPHAMVSRHATLGAGTIVMHGGVVNAAASVGRNCIINSQCLIEHDAIVGDHCHIATGARVNGGARVDSESFVGSGAVLKQGVHVGPRSIIGMGQLVLADCPPETRLPRPKAAL